MPVLDWTRTELAAPLPGGGTALRFNAQEYAAFDCFMLARQGAEADQPPDVLARARAWIDRASGGRQGPAAGNIMAGLPGAYDRYDVPDCGECWIVTPTWADGLRNLARFLREVVPAARKPVSVWASIPTIRPARCSGCRASFPTGMTWISSLPPWKCGERYHPVHRLAWRRSGRMICPAIAARFASRIHFVHLRNVTREPDGSFMEADHLGGDIDMVAVIAPLLREQAAARRRARHGGASRSARTTATTLLDDAHRTTHPGYPLIGRMRGLAELRGVMVAVAALERLPL